MKKTLKIEGMSCMNCAAHVAKALESIDGVLSVVVDLENKEAEVNLEYEIDNAVFKKAIEEEGYVLK